MRLIPGNVRKELDAFMHLIDACGYEVAAEIICRRPWLLAGMAKQPYAKQIPWVYVEIWKDS